MNNKGLWIVVEGIDGAGKTSAIKTIQSTLNQHGLSCEVFREPGGTDLGEKIRAILKTEHLSIYPLAEVLLFYAARVQLLETVILPKLEASISVLLDRFELSTFAYQSGGRGLDISTVRHISQICVGTHKPDLTIFLSVRPKIAFERIMNRGGQMDYIEKQSLEFFENVALTYEMLLEKYPNVVEIDANQDFNAVQADIENYMNDWLRTKVE